MDTEAIVWNEINTKWLNNLRSKGIEREIFVCSIGTAVREK